MVQDDETRNFTTKLSRATHRRLRLLAASRDQTIAEVLTDLINGAALETPEEVATFKSFVEGAAQGASDDQQQPRPKVKKRKPVIDI